MAPQTHTSQLDPPPNTLESLAANMAQIMETINKLVTDVASLKNGEGTSTSGGQNSQGGNNPRDTAVVSQYGRLTKVEFPKFYGEDVQGWLYRVNQFFDMDHINSDAQKFKLVSMHVFDKALN